MERDSGRRHSTEKGSVKRETRIVNQWLVAGGSLMLAGLAAIGWGLYDIHESMPEVRRIERQLDEKFPLATEFELNEAEEIVSDFESEINDTVVQLVKIGETDLNALPGFDVEKVQGSIDLIESQEINEAKRRDILNSSDVTSRQQQDFLIALGGVVLFAGGLVVSTRSMKGPQEDATVGSQTSVAL